MADESVGSAVLSTSLRHLMHLVSNDCRAEKRDGKKEQRSEIMLHYYHVTQFEEKWGRVCRRDYHASDMHIRIPLLIDGLNAHTSPYRL